MYIQTHDFANITPSATTLNAPTSSEVRKAVITNVVLAADLTTGVTGVILDLSGSFSNIDQVTFLGIKTSSGIRKGPTYQPLTVSISDNTRVNISQPSQDVPSGYTLSFLVVGDA